MFCRIILFDYNLINYIFNYSFGNDQLIGINLFLKYFQCIENVSTHFKPDPVMRNYCRNLYFSLPNTLVSLYKLFNFLHYALYDASKLL